MKFIFSNIFFRSKLTEFDQFLLQDRFSELESDLDFDLELDLRHNTH